MGRAFIRGVALWVAATVATWPLSLSFADEVGYIGAARMLVAGTAHPMPAMPGIWFSATHGLVPKYPLLWSLMLAPVISVWPRAVFAISVTALLCIAEIARRWLKENDCDEQLSLLVLAHPTLVLLARTVMADVALSLFTLGAWRALSGDRRLERACAFAGLCTLKPTGFVIAAALIAGEFVRTRSARGLASSIAGVGAAAVLTVALNFLASGQATYGYLLKPNTAPMFSAHYLSTSGVAHAKSLLLCPPLLLLGAWPYWRARQFGPLLVIVAVVGLMSVYFFVDFGRGPLDSIVLSQRLILPAVTFLLLGYAQLLSGLCSSIPAMRLAAQCLWLLPACVVLAVGLAQHRWQANGAAALRGSEELLASHGETRLGVTPGAVKAGLMHDGPVVLVGAKGASDRPGVVLCNRVESYRANERDLPCSVAGYSAVKRFGSYGVLRRASDNNL